MKNLLLITQGFPYGESEQSFLRTEFLELTKNFNVTVLAGNNNDEIIYPFEDIKFNCIKKEKSIFNSSKEKYKFFLRNLKLESETINDIKKALKTKGQKHYFKTIKSIIAYSVTAKYLMTIIRPIIENQKIDIVYTFWCTEDTVAALRLKKEFPNLKVVTRFHGYDLYKERVDTTRWQPLRFYIAKEADKLVFVSKKGETYFNENWANNKSLVSYLGCKEYKRLCFGKPKDKLVLASCSNVIPLKRIDLIIKSLAMIPSSINVEWHHIGDGEEYEKLNKVAEGILKDKNNVSWKFEGRISQEDLASAYERIRPDVFITTSSTEGLPISILEAFAMGIPVIATDVGGISEEVIDGETGLLLPSNPSLEEISESIINFYNMEEPARQKLSDNAYKSWKEKYSAKENAILLAEEFCKIIEEA